MTILLCNWDDNRYRFVGFEEATSKQNNNKTSFWIEMSSVVVNNIFRLTPVDRQSVKSISKQPQQYILRQLDSMRLRLPTNRKKNEKKITNIRRRCQWDAMKYTYNSP